MTIFDNNIPEIGTSNPGRMPGIDGLRVVAISGVLFEHWCYLWLRGLPSQFNPGRMGVDLFFVVSGFLITGILLRAIQRADGSVASKQKIIKSFYSRRFLRIFPLYYAVIGITYLIGVPAIVENLAWHVTYTTNIHNCIYGTPFPAGHFWSLAIEEQFYIFWPLVILLTPRRWVGVMLVGTILLRPCVAFGLSAFGYDHLLNATPLGKAHMLVGGALLAYGCEVVPPHSLFNAMRRYLVVAIGVQLAYSSGVLPDAILCREVCELNCAFLFAGMVLWASLLTAHQFFGFVLTNSVIVYIGGISYGIYVIHMFVPDLVRWMTGSAAATFGKFQIPAFFAVTLLLAMGSWHLYEGPINRLKSYFPYTDSD